MTLYEIWIYIIVYLIGAIPTAVWFGEIFYKKDVRKYGSGNAGATNTFRVLGPIAGSIVLALDILKGIIAVQFAASLPHSDIMPNPGFLFQQMLLGLIATIGHIFPVYLRFKGGKGVATFFGVVLYLFPLVALVCVIVFLIVFFITHYVSLSSMIASVAFPISVYFLYLKNLYDMSLYFKNTNEMPLIIFIALIPVIICYTHRKNISRILNGTETKMYFNKKENPL